MEKKLLLWQGKGKTDKYWKALGRALVSEKLLKEVIQTGTVGYRYSWMGYQVTSKGEEFAVSKEKQLLLLAEGDLGEKKLVAKPSVIGDVGRSKDLVSPGKELERSSAPSPLSKNT